MRNAIAFSLGTTCVVVVTVSVTITVVIVLVIIVIHGCVDLVASNFPLLLYTLPGDQQRPGETNCFPSPFVNAYMRRYLLNWNCQTPHVVVVVVVISVELEVNLNALLVMVVVWWWLMAGQEVLQLMQFHKRFFFFVALMNLVHKRLQEDANASVPRIGTVLCMHDVAIWPAGFVPFKTGIDFQCSLDWRFSFRVAFSHVVHHNKNLLFLVLHCWSWCVDCVPVYNTTLR